MMAFSILGFNLDGCTQSTGDSARALSQREYEIRRQRIIDFFEARRKRYDIVLTTRTASGQIIDWIRPEQQVQGGRVATSPSASEAPIPASKSDKPAADSLTVPPKTSQTDYPLSTEIQVDDSAKGPPGTVPIVRFDLESYFQNNPKFLPENPMDILTKSHVPPPSAPPDDH